MPQRSPASCISPIDTFRRPYKRLASTAKLTLGLHATIYKPSAYLCLRGGKMVEFSGKQHRYDTQKFLLCASDLPILGRVEHYPFLSVSIKFQSEDILKALKEIEGQSRAGRLKSSLYFGDMRYEIADAVSRLISLLRREPASLKHLERLAIKEILYMLILSGAGEFLSRFVMQGTAENSIARAMREIKSRFKEPINMRELAAELGISPSSLYHNFKKITALSPLDFQKRIRLQEARYILQNSDSTASQAVFDVGYKSPSQFSREYARIFGMPPKAHAQTLRG